MNIIIKNLFRKSLTFTIIILFLGTNIIPITNGNNREINNIINNLDFQMISSVFNESLLDLHYIYGITENLSYIIFNEYNESAGEIAKGRAFGTIGEQKAAQILLENMTRLGLWAYPEKIGDAQPWRCINRFASKIDVLDYELIIRNRTTNKIVVCAPIIAKIGPRNRPYLLNYNFSYTGLKILRNHNDSFDEKTPYVLLTAQKGPKINETVPVFNQFIRSGKLEIIENINNYLTKLREYYSHPYWKGSIVYDFNEDEHNQWNSQSFVPKFNINGSIGKMLNESDNINNYTVDFYLNQRLNKSVDSYNVIGQLNGSDNSKTVIVCCLYDSWWCQGTGDSAIGMAIVMGIAKYFMDNQIFPHYKIKFIGFCGEEEDRRGSKYYEATHKDENIIYVIDLNQLGFTQEIPRLTLEIAANNQSFLDEVWKIVQRTNYTYRTGNVTDIMPIFMENGHISDDNSFASKRPNSICKTVCFLKNGCWLMHHRDGLNHTVGDVIDYFNSTDVGATGDIILNVTLNLTSSTENKWYYLPSSHYYTPINLLDFSEKLQENLKTFDINMTKNKAINIPLFLQRFFQRFPFSEKILKQHFNI